MKINFLVILAIALAMVQSAIAGPGGFALCQAKCVSVTSFCAVTAPALVPICYAGCQIVCIVILFSGSP